MVTGNVALLFPVFSALLNNATIDLIALRTSAVDTPTGSGTCAGAPKNLTVRVLLDDLGHPLDRRPAYLGVSIFFRKIKVTWRRWRTYNILPLPSPKCSDRRRTRLV